MKILKSVFASFLLLTIVAAFTTKRPTDTTKYLEFTNTTTPFTISTGTDAQLTTIGNWGGILTSSVSCTGSSKLCQLTLTYDVTKSPDLANYIQRIIDGAATNYNQSSHVFTNATYQVLVPETTFPFADVTVTVGYSTKN